MISYELALKLKEAGFPQVGGEGTKVFKDRERGDGTIENGYFIKCPTLSELIEACLDKEEVAMRIREEFSLTKHIGIGDTGFYMWWKAGVPRKGEWFAFSGPSPEEAVANLYLALHK